mgnify:CR=1 FL=1
MWAITDFTKENGATQVVPGSHKWDKDRIPLDKEIENAEMSAGSVFIYTGSVMHGGGANQTSENRLGVFLHYAPNWLRQEENQYLSCPPSIAKELEPGLNALFGMSYDSYENEYEDIFAIEDSLKICLKAFFLKNVKGFTFMVSLPTSVLKTGCLCIVFTRKSS